MDSSGSPKGAADSKSKRYWRGPFLVALAATILCGLDPLGIEEATADRSEQTVMRIASAFYPSPFSEKKDEDTKVTVVLLDKEFANRNGGTWPVRYDDQGHLLSRINAFDPKAIFLDLIYTIPHDDSRRVSASPTVDDPTKLLAFLPPDTTIPIYIAGLARERVSCEAEEIESHDESFIDEKSILPGIRDHRLIAKQNRIALIEWKDCGNNRYPLFVGGDPTSRTPAYALYQDAKLKGCNKKDCADKWPHESYLTPLTLQWGAFPPAAQAPFYKKKACQYSDHYFSDPKWDESLLRAWRRVWVPIREFSLSAVGERNFRGMPCAAINVVPASVFTDPRSDQNQVGELIKDHFVMIGADLAGGSDFIISPVHGQVPGVEQHAMALDNLLRNDDGYLKEVPDWQLRWFYTLPILMLVAAGAWWFPAARWQRRFEIAGPLFLSVLAGYCITRCKLELSVFALFGAGLLFLIAPTAASRALLWFAFVCIIALIPIAFGWAPVGWLVVGIAAVLVGEKVYDQAHGKLEEPVIDSRIDWLMRTLTPKRKRPSVKSGDHK